MRTGLEESESLDNFLATFMSRFRLAHEPVPPPDPVSPDELLEGLQRGQELHRNPWTRLTWIRLSSGARLFAAGQPYDCSVWLAESLCEFAQIRIAVDRIDEAALETITRLINNGHFVLAPL